MGFDWGALRAARRNAPGVTPVLTPLWRRPGLCDSVHPHHDLQYRYDSAF